MLRFIDREGLPDDLSNGLPDDLPGTLGMEVEQTAFDIGKMYRQADKALGGILPGGGTAGPLSRPARTVLNAVPILDQNNPASANYYRDKVKADQQRGQRLVNEARTTTQSIVNNNLPNEPSQQDLRRLRTADQMSREAALRGVVLGDRGDTLSTREQGQSDRSFYLNNLMLRERNDASQFGREIIYETRKRDDEAYDARMNQRNQSTTKGVSWVQAINKSKGMDTAAGPEAGALGCVYAVNKVIKKAGLEVPWKDPETGEESVYIPFVTNWITSNGGSQVNPTQAKPGDIVVAMGGGHMGILTDKKDGNGNPVVLSNSSSSASMSWEFPLTKDMGIYRVPQLQR